MLITLEVPKDLSDKALSEYKTILMSVVRPRVPEDVDRLGSWCVCIKCEGEIIDAVVSLDYEPDQFRKET
jgi:hypothetical protein